MGGGKTLRTDLKVGPGKHHARKIPTREEQRVQQADLSPLAT